MSDAPAEMTVSIDYGDGTVEELVVTPGFTHFYPYADEQKYTVTVTEVGGETPTEPEPEPERQGYNPGDHTVQDVEDYVSEHPDERDTILAAEQAGKNRVTLVTWLENFTPGG